MKKLTTGRRVSSIAELEEGGDYCGPITQSDGLPRIFFLLPGARDPEATGGRRSVHSVTSPPWTFRECPDGSVEVRASILCGRSETEPSGYWHGFLDEGHVWREV